MLKSVRKSGDVVQLVRTLPWHPTSRISIVFSIPCSIAAKGALSPSQILFLVFIWSPNIA